MTDAEITRIRLDNAARIEAWRNEIHSVTYKGHSVTYKGHSVTHTRQTREAANREHAQEKESHAS